MAEGRTLNVGLHTFPSSDEEFRSYAEEALDALDRPDPELLEHAIRRRYPLATVSVRSALATMEGAAPMWYAFRRGSVARSEEGWWLGLDTWALLASDRTFVDASPAIAAIVEVPRDALLGRRIEAFANPDDLTAPDDVAALWAELERLGSADGTIRFDRLDGTPREIEYHVERDLSAPGLYRAVIRER